MGVVNVTPDSFSDGGLYLDRRRGDRHGLELEAEGAAILDIGGESTRPGAEPVDRRGGAAPGAAGDRGAVAAGAQRRRSRSTPPRPRSRRRRCCAGATIVNDVTALRGDPGDGRAVVAPRAPRCCLMHMLGEPRTMQDDPRYDDVVGEVKAFLEERMGVAIAAGVAEERIILDPGIGFGKTVAHNLELLAPAGRARGARATGADRHVAQVVPRADHRPRRR